MLANAMIIFSSLTDEWICLILLFDLLINISQKQEKKKFGLEQAKASGVDGLKFFPQLWSNVD